MFCASLSGGWSGVLCELVSVLIARIVYEFVKLYFLQDDQVFCASWSSILFCSCLPYRFRFVHIFVTRQARTSGSI